MQLLPDHFKINASQIRFVFLYIAQVIQ